MGLKVPEKETNSHQSGTFGRNWEKPETVSLCYAASCACSSGDRALDF